MRTFAQERTALQQTTSPRFGHDLSRIPIVSPLSGDRYEQEADHIADQVMRQSSGSGETAHTQHAPGKGGQPLPQSLRAFFEPRFGYDFSQVRVYPDATRAASEAQARAFTHGRDIHFNSGQYAPATREGQWLLAHELTHVIQQRDLPNNQFIQRKPDGPKTPTFRDCTAATTGLSNPNKELEQARDRASDFVDVAFAVIDRDPAKFRKASNYRVALGRHFIDPTDTDRQTIRANYKKIRDQLKPDKIRCVKEPADRDYCDKDPDAAQMAAFARGETFLCQAFWSQSITCRAITLIHEAAHHVGLGLGTHPPYRGSTEYPEGDNPPGSGETTAARVGNPDAYAYFAAHIWRETDTKCSIFVGEPETIEIIDKAPGR